MWAIPSASSSVKDYSDQGTESQANGTIGQEQHEHMVQEGLGDSPSRSRVLALRDVESDEQQDDDEEESDEPEEEKTEQKPCDQLYVKVCFQRKKTENELQPRNLCCWVLLALSLISVKEFRWEIICACFSLTPPYADAGSRADLEEGLCCSGYVGRHACLACHGG